MRNLFAVLVVAAVGFQWALLASWAVDRDLTVYRAGWSEPAAAPAPQVAQGWSPETSLASAGTTP